MYGNMKGEISHTLQEIKDAGLYKDERIIMGAQGVEIKVSTGEEVLNFCANNYLGLSSHPKVIEAAHKTLDDWGYGMSSVRFICGTQEIHKILEKKVSDFLGTEDTILYAACFDANGGVFEPFLHPDSAIITDALNHASLIDGIRLTKANRYIYEHANMNDLEEKLKESQSVKFRMIATDGVFSMDGDIARLSDICDLAEKYDALVLVDDSHATGFIGETGRGTHEYCDVMGRVDLITTTFGKALGGAMGGCTSGRKELIELLRQRSRPYLFSNSLSPVVTGATIAVVDMLSETTELRDKLHENTRYFREKMSEAGFEIRPGVHPIVPIMLYEATLAQDMARDLLDEGIYVIGFSYPVVPKGQARIRVQISAAHQKEHLNKAVSAFTKTGRKLGVLNNG
ncbi:MAG: glycine C-acetyltransferase [candidate division KSB1 bacterium]|jgi:glycine C-acetyltransferase|nr:glycine C-acetyltransferase [candidate division KSB1 bacterium]